VLLSLIVRVDAGVVVTLPLPKRQHWVRFPGIEFFLIEDDAAKVRNREMSDSFRKIRSIRDILTG
jgi:hypothetical protein